jgi:hypothetical protein
MPSVIRVAVGVHSRRGELGVAHVPSPVEVGDVVELGHGPIRLLRMVDPLRQGRTSPLAALVRVSPETRQKRAPRARSFSSASGKPVRAARRSRGTTVRYAFCTTYARRAQSTAFGSPSVESACTG